MIDLSRPSRAFEIEAYGEEALSRRLNHENVNLREAAKRPRLRMRDIGSTFIWIMFSYSRRSPAQRRPD